MLERSVDLGEVTLAILEGGEPGARPLMLVHGFSGAKEDFAQEIDRLAGRGHHVVAPDQRGHGASSQPERMDAYSLEIFAEDMVGLADRLGWTTFDLLGHSMGGMIAQVMIAEHPERISRLILMDTHHGRIGGLDQSIIDIGVQIALDQGLAVIHELLSMGDAPLGTEADQRMRAADPTYAEWSDSKLFACSNYMYASMLSMFNTVPDRLDALHAITVPTLVMVGEEDQPFLEASERMAAAVPGARLDVLAGGGHSPQFEARDAWRASLDGFLAGDSARADTADSADTASAVASA